MGLEHAVFAGGMFEGADDPLERVSQDPPERGTFVERQKRRFFKGDVKRIIACFHDACPGKKIEIDACDRL
jgi:hypothetical protein